MPRPAENCTPEARPKDYCLAQALRPFSLVVSLVACGLGVTLAVSRGEGPFWAAVLTLVAGVLLQAGVNLINDQGDLAHLPSGDPNSRMRRRIRRNTRLGALVLTLTALLAVPLVIHAGPELLVLILVGAAGALGYTQEPLNYKRRGLGVVLVFWLMGVLMVAGAQLAVSGQWWWPAFWLSLPVACLTSLLLLSNELRDWEIDGHQGTATLVVRLGPVSGRRLYVALLILSLVLPLVLGLATDWVMRPWLVLPAWLLVPLLVRTSGAGVVERRLLPPRTGRFMALLGGLYVLALLPA